MDMLGDRMKLYEKKSRSIEIINYDQPFIIRMDGHAFSNFTKKYFRKTFDPIFIEAMKRTMNDCMLYFRASTGYVHSDEISLYFPPMEVKDPLNLPNRDRGGKAYKLLSHTASYATIRFYHNLRLLGFLTNKVSFDFLDDPEFYFDSRIMLIPKEKPQEIINYFIFRSTKDCYRNCVSSLYRYRFGHKKSEGKNSGDMIKEMDNFESIPLFLKHGIFSKIETIEQLKYIPQIDEQKVVMRKQIYPFSVKIKFNEELIELFNSKYVSDEQKDKFNLTKLNKINLDKAFT